MRAAGSEPLVASVARHGADARQRNATPMNIKRMRGRHRHGGGQFRHGAGGGSDRPPLNRNHVFDSNGPDGRLRGTAQQLFEKYLQLGRDATSSGDRVMAESYFQHAEHYFRILMAMNQAAAQYQQSRRFQGSDSGDAEAGASADQAAPTNGEVEDVEMTNSEAGDEVRGTV